MGWWRTLIYVKHRLLRVADTTHNIGLGLAIGLGVSFSPLLGTHFIQAGIIALALRANAFSAMMGTFFGNPITFPFIWWASLSLGQFLFGLFGLDVAEEIPDKISLSIMWNNFMELFLPWMLGGYILMFVVIPPAYFMYYHLVRIAKKAKARAKEARRKKRLEEAE